MRAERDGKELHSLGIGLPAMADRPDKFNGHAVVVVPSAGVLIDPTLYQAIREKWQGAVSGMMAVALQTDSPYLVRGLKQIGGSQMYAVDDPTEFEIGWGDRPDINIKRQADFRDPASIRRRRRVTKALVEAFNAIGDGK
jgi:hypothetical protein